MGKCVLDILKINHPTLDIVAMDHYEIKSPTGYKYIQHKITR